MVPSRQQSVDAENAEFWNELCGTGLARSMGITEHTLDALRKFDQAYLEYYPYLLQRIPASTMASQRVLEVGLGYGTLGQKIVEAGAIYTGLDIADGPVRMMRHRLLLQQLPGSVRQGSVLDCPFADGSFDCVVAVGCFHHTGNTQRAVDETWRILRPGGRAFVMVYNKYSLRQWLKWPLATTAELARQLGIAIPRSPRVAGGKKMSYEWSSTGREAPETHFYSIAELRSMFGRFSGFQAHKENCEPVLLRDRRLVARESLLGTIGPVCGLDIYLSAIK
jgi:SAM-dependent methyltransferase